MPYIALKTFDAPGGGKRRPGDVVPEAVNWPNPQPWVNSGHVIFVSDAEIKSGRWTNYEAFAGGRAPRAPAPVHAHAPAHAKAPAHAPAPAPAPASEPEPELDLDLDHGDEPAAEESTHAAKRGTKKGKARSGR